MTLLHIEIHRLGKVRVLGYPMEASSLQLGLSEVVHLHELAHLQDKLLYPGSATTWITSQMQEEQRISALLH